MKFRSPPAANPPETERRTASGPPAT